MEYASLFCQVTLPFLVKGPSINYVSTFFKIFDPPYLIWICYEAMPQTDENVENMPIISDLKVLKSLFEEIYE